LPSENLTLVWLSAVCQILKTDTIVACLKQTTVHLNYRKIKVSELIQSIAKQLLRFVIIRSRFKSRTGAVAAPRYNFRPMARNLPVVSTQWLESTDIELQRRGVHVNERVDVALRKWRRYQANSRTRMEIIE